MNFPAYVPVPVRTYISALIDGDPTEPFGWASALESANRELLRIDLAIEECAAIGEPEQLPELRARRAKTEAHRDEIMGSIECVRRLGSDPRMREVFGLLIKEIVDDQQWRSFISAAWVAKIDFGRYRDRHRRAAAMTLELAEAAKKLSKLLVRFSETGVDGPDEFYSIPALLRQTDNHAAGDHNLQMWRVMRPLVLGDRPRSETPEEKKLGNSDRAAPHDAPVIIRHYENLKIDPAHAARENVRYAWGTAPELSAVLDTLAKAARAFRPTESGMIGAAIESRQHSEKTEYIRAFASLLSDTHRFTLTQTMQKAIAIVANVAINSPDLDVSYDDVRKALAKRDT